MLIHKPIYIIEHLEPKLWFWALEEYNNISKIVGKRNLWFTNIKSKSDRDKLKRYGKVFCDSVISLGLKILKKACILDQEAKKQLSPKQSKRFKYFIFGGILGAYPRRKRTKKELTTKLKIPAFNIGKRQMSTDNAIYTVKKICEGISLKKMRFKDRLEIRINEIESIVLPYRYNLVNGKPLISNKILRYLRKKKEF